jgi:hypothetical protein
MRFALKAGYKIGITGQMGVQNLQSHIFVAAFVVRFVD